MRIFLSDFLISSVTPCSYSSNLFLKGNMEAYWIKLCATLIDLLTNSKFAAVLNLKNLQLLLKGRYIVSTGQRGCFLIDCSCLGTTLTVGLAILQTGEHQTKVQQVLKDLLPILFKSVLIQHHIACLCYYSLNAAQQVNTVQENTKRELCTRKTATL